MKLLKSMGDKRIKRLVLAAVAVFAVLWAVIAAALPNPLGPNVRLMVGTIRNLAFLAAACIIALTVFRAVKHKRLHIVGTVFLTIALAVVLVINYAAGGLHLLFNELLNRNALVAPAEVASSARGVTERLEAEGLVLLKNEGGALPLKDARINVFGYSSGLIVYGGAGSGSSDESKNVSLAAALADAGFEANRELADFYARKNGERAQGSVLSMLGADYSIPEIAPPDFDAGLMDRAKAYSDTAVVVISRIGGEGADMPLDMAAYGGKAGTHYLQLTDAENALLAAVTGGFGKTVVIVNSSTPLNLGVLDDSGVDAALWVGGPGSAGLNAVAGALMGTVNPSGRLADTYAYDVTSAPAFYNTGSFAYLGSEHPNTGLTALFGVKTSTYNFNEYAEGIYVGYRYYETAAADGFIDYAQTVQFPFGYGLSYTTFGQAMGDLREGGGALSVDVTVTNTGAAAGKEVVQLYQAAPYTKGGIEKAHVSLIAFGKTDLLAPGASQTLTLTFAVTDLASYDYKTAGGYVVEAGDYEIKLMKNSHELIDSRVYNVAAAIYDRADDAAKAENRFADAQGEVNYISRADWAGTMPKAKTADKPITAELTAKLGYTGITADPGAQKITVKNHGIKLADMKGLAYDDPKWSDFLEQLSVKDMAYMLGAGGWQTPRIASIGKPATLEIDGPAGVNGLINGTIGNQYVSEVVAASTWNVKLLEELGEAMGREANALGVSGLYAPAMNIHRTPFSGRNFEYYSEDPFLSGKMGAAMVRGLNATGTYSYIKHFAMDDQETNMVGLVVWSNEQAIREIYLRPFEITVKEGKTKAVMSSWNRIGTTWTGANKALLTDVLRGEWGFVGAVITDNAMMGEYMDPDRAAAAGNDLMLSIYAVPYDEANTATGQQNMRRAAHNVLYNQANGHAVEYAKAGMPGWLLALMLADALALTLIGLGYFRASSVRKPKRGAAL